MYSQYSIAPLNPQPPCRVEYSRRTACPQRHGRGGSAVRSAPERRGNFNEQNHNPRAAVLGGAGLLVVATVRDRCNMQHMMLRAGGSAAVYAQELAHAYSQAWTHTHSRTHPHTHTHTHTSTGRGTHPPTCARTQTRTRTRVHRRARTQEGRRAARGCTGDRRSRSPPVPARSTLRVGVRWAGKHSARRNARCID